MTNPTSESAKPELCPNCLTPWKCNGPHVAPQDAAPVAWMTDDGESFWSGPDPMTEPGWIALYAAPPAQDVELLRAAHDAIDGSDHEDIELCCRLRAAIRAAEGEKQP